MQSDSRKPRLTDLLSLRLFAVAATIMAVLTGFWIHAEIRTFEQDTERMRAEMLDQRRDLLRTVVGQATQGIDYRRRQIEGRTRRLLMERVGNAVALAQHLWQTYADQLPRAEVEAIIREALRAQRFDDGRGYFFAFDRDSRNTLFADRPQFEGRDMSLVVGPDGVSVTDEMVARALANGGSAFYEYDWTRPRKDGSDHRKLAYVEQLEPLGWFIGTGAYLEDVSDDIRQEAAAWIDTIRFGADGYIFAGTWDGIGVAGPGKGRDNWVVEDANGLKVVQALSAAARDGGGFVRYVQPAVDADKGYRQEQKLSYVEPVRDWQWYVGAGLYIDDIDQEVAAARAALQDKLILTVIQGAGLFVVLAVLSYLLSRRTTRSLRREVAAFEEFFATDGRQPEHLDPEAMRSREFAILARSARAMAASRDRSERALAQQTAQLERSNADLERFAWIASHDLQEPLRSVASFLQLLEHRLGPRLRGEEAEYLDFAVKGAGRMRDQINALMAYARQQEDGLQTEDVPLAEIVAEVTEVFADQLAAVDGRVEAPDLPVVPADRALLGTILQNLLSNALKFRAPKRPPLIRISAEYGVNGDGAVWRIAVADNGSGIPAGYRRDAFALLKRLHGPDTPGTGVGLAMVKKLVEAHGGRVGMSDGLDGVGVTVWFTLPEHASAVGAPVTERVSGR